MSVVGPRPGVALSFPKERRLRRRSDFLAVQTGGSRITLPSFIVLLRARRDDGPARLGITVTRKFGGAVQRNRLKRLMREIFRLSPHQFPDGIDFVVIPKATAPGRLELAPLAEEWARGARLIAARADSLRRALANTPPAAQTPAPGELDR